MPFVGPSLQITVTGALGVVSVTVCGEIDMATAPELRDAALDALRSAPVELHIDLGGVTFMDSTGLFVLLGTRRRTELMGIRLVLCRVPERVKRLLELGGVRQLFQLEDECAAGSVEAEA